MIRASTGAGGRGGAIGRGYGSSSPAIPTASHVVQMTSVAIGVSLASLVIRLEVISDANVKRAAIAKLRRRHANSRSIAKLVNLVKHVQHVESHFDQVLSTG